MIYKKNTAASAPLKEDLFPHGSTPLTFFFSLTKLLTVALLLLNTTPSLAQVTPLIVPTTTDLEQSPATITQARVGEKSLADDENKRSSKGQVTGNASGEQAHNYKKNNKDQHTSNSQVKAHNALANDLRRQLETDARLQLATFAQVQGWLPYHAKLSTWVPTGVAHLPTCPQAVQVHKATSGAKPWGRVSYVLRCIAEPGWTLRARVTVAVTLPVWITTEPLKRDQVIDPHQLRLKSMNIKALHRGFISSPLPPKRRVLRDLSLGQPIYPTLLAPVWLVEKNQQVVVEARGKNFSVSTKGLALNNGSKGELIAVQNLDSGKRIQARVVAKNRVQSLR